MDNLYRSGITDLDNVPPHPWETFIRFWPFGVNDTDILTRFLRDSTPPTQWMTSHSCNLVAKRWQADRMALASA